MMFTNQKNSHHVNFFHLNLFFYFTAQDAGVFKEEMSPVTVKVKKQEKVIAVDEHPRPDTTMEMLSKLPTLFRKGGIGTAGNSSVSKYLPNC